MIGVKTYDFCQVLSVLCHMSAIQFIQTLPTLGGMEGVVPVKILRQKNKTKELKQQQYNLFSCHNFILIEQRYKIDSVLMIIIVREDSDHISG